MRIDNEGNSVPAFNYDYAIHQYFKEKEKLGNEENKDEEEVLKPKRAKQGIDLGENLDYFNHHVFVSAPKLKTLRAKDLPLTFPKQKPDKMTELLLRSQNCLTQFNPPSIEVLTRTCM
jgi:hypothetical protein